MALSRVLFFTDFVDQASSSHGFLENGEKERNFAYNDKKKKRKKDIALAQSILSIIKSIISIIRYSFSTKHNKHNKI